MTETATPTLTFEQFPIFVGTFSNVKERGFVSAVGLTERLLVAFRDDILPLVNTSLAAGQIANPRYGELKEWVNRRLDEGYRILVREPYFYAGKWESLPAEINRVFDDISILYAHTLPGVIARLEKAERKFGPHAVLTAALAYLREIKPLTDAVLTLKTKTVKMAQLREPAEPAYQAPQVSHRDVERVKALLRQITEQTREEQVASLIALYTKRMESFLAAQDRGGLKPGRRGFSDYFMGDMSLACDALRQVGPRRNEDPFEKAPEFDAVIQRKAEQDAKWMQERFVHKNGQKLDSILVAKNNLDLATIGEVVIRSGVITGWLHLTFKDGTKFSVKNIVVYGYSQYRRFFMRFPTTFHAVQFLDGRTLKKASEEQMNEEFAKAV